MAWLATVTTLSSLMLLAAVHAGAGRLEPSSEPVAVPVAAEPEPQPDPILEHEGIPDEVKRERMNNLAAELRRIASAHGPDSVILQTKLLMRSLAAGAIGPTEVRVAGPSARLGKDYLEIDIDTGIIFAEPETTQNGRTDAIWREVAGPVLEDMKSFHLDPGGLELVFQFGVQATADKPDAAKPSRFETFSVSLPASKLASAALENQDSEAIRAVADFGHLSDVEARTH
ncbi:MAG TPA: hypothetical protein VEL28_00260 [Candidatus Binatia bacterium]|nr:hypothetical protein [Candidatus Binatia bacterium]